MYPKELRYSTEHEWAKVEGKRVRVGITKFAADHLSDVVYIELPAVGTDIKFMEPFGVVESVKAVSDLYAPVSGKVVEINQALVEKPEVLNTDPYGEAWMIVVDASSPGEVEKLMDAAAYAALIGEVQS